MIHLSPKKKKEFYLSLLTKNFAEAGMDIGMGAIYSNPGAVRTNAHKLFKSLKPEELGIGQDIVDAVRTAIDNRKIHKGKIQSEGVEGDILDPEDSKSLVIGGRNKAAMLLHKKMDRISKNKKLLDDVSLSQLATTFGIMFDKAQIIRGEATENIAVMAKIDKNMTPEESLDMLLKMREKITEEKHA